MNAHPSEDLEQPLRRAGDHRAVAADDDGTLDEHGIRLK